MESAQKKFIELFFDEQGAPSKHQHATRDARDAPPPRVN